MALDNQKLIVKVQEQVKHIKHQTEEITSIQNKNAKLQEDYNLVKQLNKELKRDKRHFENEVLKEKVKVDQL